MKKWFGVCLAFLTVAAGCKTGPVAAIRNPNVYANELDYDAMEDAGSVKALRYWLDLNCPCGSDGFWDTDHAQMCEKTAKHILMLEIRAPYHRALQEYNGSLTDDKPPSDAPSLPSTDSFCKESP